jgi:hypothetical protein
MRLLPILCLIFAAVPAGSESTLTVPVTVRVDESQPEVSSILKIWRAYLNDHPERAGFHAKWNPAEVARYPDPDFTRAWVYPDAGTIQYFKPLVLSVEDRGSEWEIRTLYSARDAPTNGPVSNPWALQTVMARKTAEGWSLGNALPVRTASWNRTRVGRITFVYSSDHQFDTKLARSSAEFLGRLESRYALEPVPDVEFYITDNADELVRIVGLDFVLGPTEGRSNAANSQVFSARGDEWYPHELTHIAFREYRPHLLLGEGVATLHGGSSGLSLHECYVRVSEYFVQHPEATIGDVLENRFLGGTSLVYYTVGAAICQLVEDRGGPSLLRKLMLQRYPTSDELLAAVAKSLGIETSQVLTHALAAMVGR